MATAELPLQELYELFVGALINPSSGIRKFEKEGVGAVINGTHEGEGYLSLLLVFPDNVVINKIRLRNISRVLSGIMQTYPVQLQIIPIDIKTMTDGRLNFQGNYISNIINQQNNLILGPVLEYEQKFDYGAVGSKLEKEFGQKLMDSRRRLMLSEYHKDVKDFFALAGNYNSTLHALRIIPNEIVNMLDLRKNETEKKKSTLETIASCFSGVDIMAINNLRDKYTTPDRLSEKNIELIFYRWDLAVSCIEQLVHSYMTFVPKPNTGNPNNYSNGIICSSSSGDGFK